MLTDAFSRQPGSEQKIRKGKAVNVDRVKEIVDQLHRLSGGAEALENEIKYKLTKAQRLAWDKFNGTADLRRTVQTKR